MMQALLDATRDLHQSTPALQDFAPWPDDLTPQDIAPVPCPAIDLVRALPDASPLTRPIQNAAAFAKWKRTYTTEEVGQHFLDHYGYFELFGPYGHFHSTQARGYIAYWDAELDYGWHNHEAEELYYSLQGTPRFLSRNQPDCLLAPGQSRYHAPWEIHGMKTLDTSFLCYAVWRGPGLADLPAMEQP